MPLAKKLKKTNKKSEEQNEKENNVENSSDESMSQNEDDDDDDDEDTDDEKDVNKEIMIDFEARSLAESDLDSVKLLLQQKLGSFALNINEIAKIVVEQDKIGNVIYQGSPLNENQEEDEEVTNQEDDDSTIFGVLSLIDLNSPTVKTFSNNFKQFLLKECQKFDKSNSTSFYSKLDDLFKTKRVSYVVNERIVNIPPAISVPMFESLVADLEEVKNEERNFNSDYWLFISKYFLESAGASCDLDEAIAKNSKKTSKGDGEINSKVETSTKVFSNPEEEIIDELSEFKFDIFYGSKFPKSTTGGSKSSSRDPEMHPIISVLVVPYEKINDAIGKIKSLIK